MVEGCPTLEGSEDDRWDMGRRVAVIGEPTMSEARLEIVEPCEHGEFGFHRIGEWYQCEGGPRRVLSVPTDQMVEIAAEALLQLRVGSIDSPTFGAFASDEVYRYQARTILTAAFNTLGIQEKADTTLNK
jgi:hypothetical protein